MSEHQMRRALERGRRAVHVRRFWFIAGAAWLLAGLGLASRGSVAGAQRCTPGHAPGGQCALAERDARGCCPVRARPPRAGVHRGRPDAAPERPPGAAPERPPGVSPDAPAQPPVGDGPGDARPSTTCPPGQERNADTGDRCCWPGQGYSASHGRCVGPPVCPAGLLAQGEDCGCAEGKVRTSSTRGRCCWPGQVWVSARDACVGAPQCPPGHLVASQECVRPAPAGMLAIPGETFIMGTGRGERNERPPHPVTVSPYFIDRTEVTVAAYARCVQAGRCRPPDAADYRGANNWLHGRLDHPVNYVSWDDASAYCRFAGGRLPTEAEWELAARGTDGRVYPWGAAEPTPVRLRSSIGAEYGAVGGTAPVGSLPAGVSPFGVLDLAGNVAEWVGDWEGLYSEAAQHDPLGPSEGRFRVYRGGSWYDNAASWARTTRREANTSEYRNFQVGFRCARGGV